MSSSLVPVPEAFGLTSFDVLIMQFTDQEEKIRKVREILSKLIKDEALLRNGFISYRPAAGSLLRSMLGEDLKGDPHLHSTHADSSSARWIHSDEEFATILPTLYSPQHQKRIPSNHLEVEVSLRYVWAVPFMISPYSGQVNRSLYLSALTGEHCGLYPQRIQSSTRDTDGPLEINSTHTRNALRNIEPPFDNPPAKTLKPSHPDWSPQLAAVQKEFLDASQGLLDASQPGLITSDADLKADPNIDLVLAHKTGSLDFVHRKLMVPFERRPSNKSRSSGWFPLQFITKPSVTRTTNHGDLAKHRNPISSAQPSFVPYCMRLRDAADRGLNKAEDMGCPGKYYIQMSSVKHRAQEYRRFAGDGTFSIWLPSKSNWKDMEVHVDELIAVFQNLNFDSGNVIQSILEIWLSDLEEHSVSLDAFVYASKIFRSPAGGYSCFIDNQEPAPLGKMETSVHISSEG